MDIRKSNEPILGVEGAEAAYAELIEAIKRHTQIKDLKKVKAAYDFAFRSHGQQLRKDGSLYITHPLKVAAIVAEMGLDEDSIIAAILHDVIEDTDSTHEDIAKIFGESVADIVEGVTKLTRVTYTTKEEEQMEIVDLDTHFSGRALWDVAVSEMNIDYKDSDPLRRRIVVSSKEDGKNFCPVDLVNSDILASCLFRLAFNCSYEYILVSELVHLCSHLAVAYLCGMCCSVAHKYKCSAVFFSCFK